MATDAILYIILAILPAIVAMFASDEAAKFMEPAALFWLKNGISVFGAAAGAFKAFRSVSFAKHVQRQTAKRERNERNQDAQLTPNPS